MGRADLGGYVQGGRPVNPRAPSLVDPRDASHKAALRAGYSWRSVEWALRVAAEPWAKRVTRAAEAQLADVVAERSARPVSAHMPDSDIRELAQRRADLMTDRIAKALIVITPEWLNAEVEQMGGRPFAWPGMHRKPRVEPTEQQVSGFIKRAMCPMWWRRHLRRAVVELRETEAMHAGEVCKRAGQVYVTDDTVRRRAERNASNAAMLESTEIEGADGQIITLAQAVAASVANKAIRRGELMTRIRGCEEWADDAGMVGVFTTNTAPSRFHPQTMHKGANPKHDGSTARDAQGWLCNTWAKARAALKRQGVGFFGFRVAEPHHDGCPHWHMLLWVQAGQLDTLRNTMRAYWLKDEGDEAGAAEHRFKAVPIDKAKGGAIAYVAKYIAKNIDDVGALEAQGHTDEHAGEQAELFGATARRVEAWASGHRIRQFQAIGQPPVTVWRELRRVEADAVAGASDAIRAAHMAVHRQGERRADWKAYMQAQGGAMTGRGYRVRIVADKEQREGRYGMAEVLLPRGVEDVRRAGEWVLSARQEWRPRGTWGARERVRENPLRDVVFPGSAPQAPCPPRTRLNNCTRANGARDLLAMLEARQVPISSWAGGPHLHERSHEPPHHPPGQAGQR